METKQKVNGILMLEVFLKVEVHSNGFIGKVEKILKGRADLIS